MRGFGGKWVLCLAVTLVLAASVPLCRARSGSKAEKHAQKIQKKLSKYKAGTLLHLEFNDNTECTGTLKHWPIRPLLSTIVRPMRRRATTTATSRTWRRGSHI